MQTTPGSIPAGAVDLNKHMAEKAAQQATDEQESIKAAMAQAAAWEKAMHKAFKGTIGGTRAQRRRALMSAARRQGADA